jgi:hypothetical protein
MAGLLRPLESYELMFFILRLLHFVRNNNKFRVGTDSVLVKMGEIKINIPSPGHARVA